MVHYFDICPPSVCKLYSHKLYDKIIVITLILLDSSISNIEMVNNIQYCQTRSVNILTRVCRELTRLSRSKHTLVNILTIGQLEHPQMTLDDPPFLDHRKLKLACRNMIVKKKIKKINLLKSYGLFSVFLYRPQSIYCSPQSIF